MVKCFEVNQLSMKFQRNLDCEIVDFTILEPDWKKLSFLLANRVIEIHSQAGFYYKVRVPRFGREMLLHRSTSELYVCGEGEEVYRLNMEYGKFMAPLLTKSGAGGGNNCLAVNPINQLVAFGGEGGVVEAWDPRDLSRNKAAGELTQLRAFVHGSDFELDRRRSIFRAECIRRGRASLNALLWFALDDDALVARYP
mmetsp:Transcript_9704/g.41621  ORF Transcript_9704/g.41621 Transcript_9704/m.41621 type:complete len:197 (+) Transcript_9704:836-1426(+)